MLSTIDTLAEVGSGVQQGGKKLCSRLVFVGHVEEGLPIRVVVKHAELLFARAVLSIAQVQCISPDAHRAIWGFEVKGEQPVQPPVRVLRSLVDFALASDCL